MIDNLNRRNGRKMLLDSTRSGLEGAELMEKTGRANPPQLSWEDIGFICEGLAFASRLLWSAIGDVTEQYSLGPRGAWIVRLVGRSDMSPLDLTNVFRVGRSLITAELVRLTQAKLITYEKS